MGVGPLIDFRILIEIGSNRHIYFSSKAVSNTAIYTYTYAHINIGISLNLNVRLIYIISQRASRNGEISISFMQKEKNPEQEEGGVHGFFSHRDGRG